MRSSVHSLAVGLPFLAVGLAVGLLALGCASPKSADTGSAGTSGSGTGNNSGSAGTSSSGSAGTSSSGSAGTSSSGSAGTSGSGTAGTSGACTPGNPANLVETSGWICDLTTPVMIQGSWYSYGDNANTPNSGCTPATGNPCTSGSCCMMGATVVDMPAYKAWGCGLGMELSSSGGTTPTKSVYAGPVKCFDITLTGSSGNNVVLRSTGTNGWSVNPEFSTNLTTTNWFALTVLSNRFQNGISETICGRPPGSNVFFRIRSQPN